MEPSDAIHRIWREVGDVLAQVDEAEVALLVEELLKARRVFVTGEGRSGFVGRAFAMRLMHIGLSVYAVGDVITPAVAVGDFLVVISGSGRTAVTRTITERALAAGGQACLVSSEREGPIASLVHHVLVIPGKTRAREGETTSIQPMGSLFDQSAHLVLDAICVLLMEKLGGKETDLETRHTNL